MMEQDKGNKNIEMEDFDEANDDDDFVENNTEDECPKCNKLFPDFEALIEHCSAIHYLKVDTEIGGLLTMREICESCKEIFDDYDALIEHNNATHNNNNVIIDLEKEKNQLLELHDQLDSMETISDVKNTTNLTKNEIKDFEVSNDLDSIYLANESEPATPINLQISKKRKSTDEKGNISEILKTNITKEFEDGKNKMNKQMNADLPYEVIDLGDDEIDDIIKEKINSSNKDVENENSVYSQHPRKVTISAEVLTNVIQANNLLKLVKNNNLSLSTVTNDKSKSRILDNDDSDDDSIIFIENEEIEDPITLNNSEVCFDEAFKKYFLIEMCLEEDTEIEKLESSWENIRDSIWEDVYPIELNELEQPDIFNTPPSSPEMITGDESPEITTGHDSFKSSDESPEITTGYDSFKSRDEYPEITIGHESFKSSDESPEIPTGHDSLKSNDESPEITTSRNTSKSSDESPEINTGQESFKSDDESPEITTSHNIFKSSDESPEITTGHDSFKSELSDELEYLFEEWMSDLES